MHAVAIINPNMRRYTTSFFLDNTRSPIIFLFLPIIHIIARGAINAKTKNIRRYRTRLKESPRWLEVHGEYKKANEITTEWEQKTMERKHLKELPPDNVVKRSN